VSGPQAGREIPEIPKEPPVSDSQFRRTRNTMILNPSVTMARKWCLTFSAGKPTRSPHPKPSAAPRPSPSSKGSPRWPRIATAYDPNAMKALCASEICPAYPRVRLRPMAITR
jgi:hypothetical protein